MACIMEAIKITKNNKREKRKKGSRRSDLIKR